MAAVKASTSTKGPAAFRNTANNLERAYRDQRDLIKAFGDVDVRQHRAISSTEQYTKALRDQKIGIGQAIKNRKLLNKVVREQIDLQRAQVVSTSRMPDGRIVSDLYIPKDAISRAKMFRGQLAMMNATLASVA